MSRSKSTRKLFCLRTCLLLSCVAASSAATLATDMFPPQLFEAKLKVEKKLRESIANCQRMEQEAED